MGFKPRARWPVELVVPVLLRRKLEDVDHVAARLGRAANLVRQDTLRHVCAVVDDDTLVALARALRARGIDARALVVPLAQRGFAPDAIALTDEHWISEVRTVRDLVELEQLAPWRDHLLGELRRLLGEQERNSVSLLTAAEVGIEFVTAEERAEIVEDLFQLYTRDAEAGWYDELDYPYGEIDPTLRLARVFIVAGQPERGLDALKERDGRYPAFLNFDELEAAAGLLCQLDGAKRDEWFWRLCEWARLADQDNYKDRRFEAAWLCLAHTRGLANVESELHQLVTHAPKPSPLCSVTQLPTLPASVRAAALATAVELVEALVPAATRSTPNAAVWQLLAGTSALANAAGELTDAQRQRLHPTAARWARWYVDKGSGALEQRQTAVAWAAGWRDEMSPVGDALLSEIQRGDHYWLRVRRWDRLCSDEDVARILAML